MKSIKKLILLCVCSALIFSTSSCDSFFEPLPEEKTATEEVEETKPTIENSDSLVFTESVLNDSVTLPDDNSSSEEVVPPLVEEETAEQPEVEELPSENETTEEKEEILPENTDKPLEEVEKEEVVEKPSNEENNYPTSDGYYVSEALVFTSGTHVLKDLIIICDNDDKAAIYAEGAGTIIIIESGVYYGGTNGSSAPAVYARDGATVIINGGSFYTGEGNATVYAKNYAYVEINDGSFMALAPWQNHYYVLNLADNTNSKILVKGGMFRKFDPSNNYSENPCVNFVAEGYRVVPVVKENGDIWYKVEILKK